QPIGIAPPAKESPSPFILKIEMEDEVRVKNRYLNLGILGSPEVRYDGDLKVAGRVELVPGGRVQVLGRNFVVEEGNIAFSLADPKNPHLHIIARWRAPNGTSVRASVSGTPEKLKVEWSSDPPLPGGEAAVMALVLGGGRTDDTGAEYMALALAMNEALGKVSNKIDIYTSKENEGSDGEIGQLNERTHESYAAAFQLNDKVWFEGSYQIMTAGPGSQPQSGISGAIDWRFADDWSLRTEAGALGVGLDLMWHYRY
ncbi:MAG: translocation/assembly module TamB, partial [Polyangiaceae bacterium]|nr:translocation/assembly module TamB [Polyangiaceae bacterium]